LEGRFKSVIVFAAAGRAGSWQPAQNSEHNFKWGIREIGIKGKVAVAAAVREELRTVYWELLNSGI
jgi:hypothetical protein